MLDMNRQFESSEDASEWSDTDEKATDRDIGHASGDGASTSASSDDMTLEDRLRRLEAFSAA